MAPSFTVTVTQSFELIWPDLLSLSFFFFFFFKAALKLDDDEKTPAPPLFQENVFIESSRPKYLEDLHTEALQGLKMMQEEGIKPTTDIPSTCLFFPRF